MRILWKIYETRKNFETIIIIAKFKKNNMENSEKIHWEFRENFKNYAKFFKSIKILQRVFKIIFLG